MRRNGWCTDTWSDCACDGAELCSSGSNGIDNSGCVPALPATGTGATFVSGEPCETDKRYCTSSVPFCCEPPENLPTPGRRGCRNVAQLVGVKRLEYDAACYDGGLASLFRTRPRRATTGEMVTCVLKPNRRAPLEWPIFQDQNPCTNDYCVEPTTFPWVPRITNPPKPRGQVVNDPIIGVPGAYTGVVSHAPPPPARHALS